MDPQEKFIKYLSQVEDIGDADKREVINEFLQFFKFGYNESAQIVMTANVNGDEAHCAIGEMRLAIRVVRMIEDIREDIKTPKPQGEQ